MTFAQCWTYVSGGAYHTLAVQENGTLWAWGRNNENQLRDGTSLDSHNPIQIGNDTDWEMVSGGFWHSVAIKTDGTLWAWGDNFYYQLGDGTSSNRIVPTQIGTDTNWKFVAAGFWHTVALKTDGTIWVFGSNNDGVLGNGFTIPKYFIPTQVGTDSDWESISTSRGHVLALKTNGELWTWGGGHLGALGTGNQDNQHLPIQVGTDSDWNFISANDWNSYAIKTDETLWAWGWNDWGQLGNGSYNISTVPIQVEINSAWSFVNSCAQGVMAIKTDGTLWSWGSNFAGQLALGYESNNVPIPNQVGGNSNWQFVGHAPNAHLMAISDDGKLWGSGRNIFGEIGDGTTINRSVPTEIVCIPLNVEEYTLNTSITLYPNPTQDYFIVKLGTEKQADFNYKLTDIQGRVLVTSQAVFGDKIYLDYFKSGNYFLIMNINGKTITSKLVIK